MPILCRISQIEAKGIEGYYDTNPLGDNNIMAKDEHQSLYQTRYKITTTQYNRSLACALLRKITSIRPETYLQLPLRQWGADNVYILVLFS